MPKSSGKTAADTPLMRQYAETKGKFPGALLLFRVGDFYETFGEDAVQCASVLGITLTKRANGAASEIELAGFPHHSLEQYLPRLVRSGLRVAVCDQIEDPKLAKGLVKREVTELVSPAVAFSDSLLDHRRNNYLCALQWSTDQESVGLAFCDASTGAFQATQCSENEALSLLRRYMPSEVLANKRFRSEIRQHWGENWPWQWLEDWIWEGESARTRLTRQFQSQSVKGFGLDGLEAAQIAAGAVLYYLNETRRDGPLPLYGLSRLDAGEFLWMDPFTVRTLELLEPQQAGGMSLAECLQATVTPMGARMLRQWLAFPLRDTQAIEDRLKVVDWALVQSAQALVLRDLLAEVGDMERLAARVGVLRAGPRDLVQLSRSLQATGRIQELLQQMQSWPWMAARAEGMHPCTLLAERLAAALKEDAPALLSKGGVIRPGVSSELDRWRQVKEASQETMHLMLQEEIKRTQISSLKINYNQVFGFYLEVTHAHKDKVPTDWLRKQTLVNAERYITPALKEFEEQFLAADHKIQELESALFTDLLKEASSEVALIQASARSLAALDVLLGFAGLAAEHRYTRPLWVEGSAMKVKGLRHPVLERILPASAPYVPNDLNLDPQVEQIWMITGPNMSGKSALLRQAGLMVVMAQVGSYVAADQAILTVVDKLFTRVGASDNLTAGESTFMVEMQEMATILHHMSAQSLLLLDEIGRGTSTYDGISLAWSIAAYLHEHPKHRPKTLFATHYHELNEMASQYPRMANYHVAVSRQGTRMEFLRTLKPGGSSHSFGLHVAGMAGIPRAVLQQAQHILERLEGTRSPAPSQVPAQGLQLQLFEAGDPVARNLQESLMLLDTNEITPMEALQWIVSKQQKILPGKPDVGQSSP